MITTSPKTLAGALAAALLAAGLVGTGLVGTGLVGTLPAYAATTCSSGVAGDANGDGYAEVAVGSPGQRNARGAVNVFYGSPSGLVADPAGSAPGDLYLTQDTPGVPGAAGIEDYFGGATAFGDFNHDGCADLAIGASGDSGSGSVTILFGSPTGLSTAGIVRLTAKTVTSKTEAYFGNALVTGDLNGDGVDDLAVAVSGLKVEKSVDAGGVVVFYGSAKGLGGTLSPKVVTQASKGIPGTARRGDSLGSALAIANIDGKGRNELVIGSSEDHGDVGSVQVVKTTTHGFATTGQAAPISDDTVGLRHESLNEFGTAIAVGDVNGDGYADVAAGSPESDVSFPDGGNDNGAVFVLLGSAKGLTTKGIKKFNGGKEGVPGDKTSGGFGLAVVLAPVNADAFDDLVVGVPSTTIDDSDYAGAVTVLFGGSTGITTTGALGINETTPGLGGGGPALYDGFGSTLTTALVRGTDRPSLVVAAPGRPSGAVNGVGAVWELPAGAGGPQGAGSKLFTPNTPGVQGGPAAENTGFGSSLSSS